MLDNHKDLLKQEKVVLILVALFFPLYSQVMLFLHHKYKLLHHSVYKYLNPIPFQPHFFQLIFFHKLHQLQLEVFVHQQNIHLLYKYNKHGLELHMKLLNNLQLVCVVQTLRYLYLYMCLALTLSLIHIWRCRRRG